MLEIAKRVIDGICHWVNKNHLQKYLNEFNFRYNTKNFKNSQKFIIFLSNLKAILSYDELVW